MKSQFHQKEFVGMMYNPDKIPEGANVLTFYKDLSKVREFRLDPGEGIDNNKLMIYILLMYDKNSPYRRKYADVLKRKIEVAHDTGFETIEGGNFDSPVEDFLRGKNRVVNQKVVAYVRLHRSYKYSYQISVESAYYNLMIEILGGETKNISKARELKDELEDNLLELLNQDNNPILKDEILRFMEDERLKLRPEDIALKLQSGETPIEIKSFGK
jgi:hypothetical protein